MKSIKAKDLMKKIENKKVNVIDVRESFEFGMGHIPSAKNFPLSTLQDTAKSLDKNQTYYVICQSGARSANACGYLDQLGFDIINVEGGMNAWQGDID
ncbi:rhodanese-like domain-containing protein [Pediococcus acidilactici]|uniref:rhodanese-like domain-containing protein n=1 Tax=Pediococcus acidilactici TaxID=1254 RepID=UPI00137BEFA3|nr:rhodanese-like domain-containing protein [Pediococcus acidilactici]MBW9300724.1 rhodanese-like domain-containing protein [Pediococcus acidilactici]QHS04021.1 rhodanese-like domain-containing protein [Pediococcus acidilactici]